METFVSSFIMIFLAEMGDKSQLLALAFVSRFSVPATAAGYTLGVLATNLLAATVGAALGIALPVIPLKICAGLLFLTFAVLTVISRGDDERAATRQSRLHNPLLVIILGTFLAECGDKTQLAALTLAAESQSFFPVWLGSSLGMVVAVSLAIVIGAVVKRRLPEKAVRYASAAVFGLFGVMTAIDVVHLLLDGGHLF